MNITGKWIRVGFDGDIYTEILNMGHSYALRILIWDYDKDKVTSVSMCEIDRLSGEELLKVAHREKEKKDE